MNTGIIAISDAGMVELLTRPSDGPFESLLDIMIFDNKDSLMRSLYSLTALPVWVSRLEHHPDSDSARQWEDALVTQFLEVPMLADYLWKGIQSSVQSSTKPEEGQTENVRRAMLIKDAQVFLFKVCSFK